MDNYYSEYKKSVKRLERDVRSLENELDVIDNCVGRKTVVDLIHEIVLALISEKGQKKNKDFIYTSESSEESDSDERSHGCQVREKKAVPHKQRRRERSRKVKRTVV
ncbi:hypothetical protein RhiirC2_800095 [Rhizophagus irregularis]|uniref:Uncharacterized protein n=1 Tax=Rhizophagus irregularis TaxID=588596 RepID=A0A2N1M433_9GLOM|nr:hypothetical protein RhiirC2_800095 [Rhizophagus irregularis]